MGAKLRIVIQSSPPLVIQKTRHLLRRSAQVRRHHDLILPMRSRLLLKLLPMSLCRGPKDLCRNGNTHLMNCAAHILFSKPYRISHPHYRRVWPTNIVLIDVNSVDPDIISVGGQEVLQSSCRAFTCLKNPPWV